MDLRGYGLPFHLPSLRGPSSGVGSDLSDPHEYQGDYAFGDLSLSDDLHSGDMPHQRASIKNQAPKGSSRSRDSKHRSMKQLATQRNHNPGIDVALRNLDHEVNTSLRMSQAFIQDFEGQIEPLQEWADEFTLDTVWRNKVKTKLRENHGRERFEGVPERVLACRVSLKEAIAEAKTVKAAWEDRYKIESQIRTAKKAVLYCDGIIDLAERAASERQACKQLVLELDEARGLLDRRRHPWIYDEDAIMEQSDDLKGRNSPKWDGKFEEQDESGRTEKDGQEYQFDKPSTF